MSGKSSRSHGGRGELGGVGDVHPRGRHMIILVSAVKL